MNHEKLETIKQITLAALVIVIMFSFLYYLNAPERLRLAQVQAGELILECHIKKTGLTIIAPEKVTGHSDNYWYFKNGLSSRCTTNQRSNKMRCYNTEAADKWAQEQDDHEAEHQRKREKLHRLLDEKSELIAEFLRDKFAQVISDDNDEYGHAALESIFLKAFFEDSTDKDCEFLMSESELMDKLGDALDD